MRQAKIGMVITPLSNTITTSMGQTAQFKPCLNVVCLRTSSVSDLGVARTAIINPLSATQTYTTRDDIHGDSLIKSKIVVIFLLR